MIYHCDKATVVAVHDGDTITVRIELTPWVRTTLVIDPQKVRFAGINAPELANPDGSGKAALAYLDDVGRRTTGVDAGEELGD